MANTVSRRGFIATIGAAAAASAVPSPARAKAAAPRTWRSALAAWPEAVAAMKASSAAIVERFRPAYFAELRRFTEELRPRFAAGELYGYRGDDDQEGQDRLEELCAERFGVEVRRVEGEEVGDEITANMINAVSPSAEHWMPEEDWYHPGYCAQACAAFDVLAVARALGIHRPAPDEAPGEKLTKWAQGVFS